MPSTKQALRLLAALLLGACSISHSVAEPASPDITWVKNDAPPFYIRSNASDLLGIGDQIQRFIEDALPQYRHTTISLPLPRLNQAWAAGDPLCFSTMIHTPEPEAEADYLLSRANIFYPAHGVVMRREAAQRLSPDGKPVSLADLLGNPTLLQGRIAARTFGPVIDKLLAEHKAHLPVQIRNGSDETLGIFKMLSKKRFDYLIEYRFILDYYQAHTRVADELVFLPLQEVQGSGVYGAIGCTRSPWGERVIQDIDSAIESLLASPAYRSLLLSWMAGGDADYWQTHFPQAAAATQ